VGAEGDDVTVDHEPLQCVVVRNTNWAAVLAVVAITVVAAFTVLWCYHSCHVREAHDMFINKCLKFSTAQSFDEVLHNCESYWESTSHE
jgi:hypothetical protein